MLKFKQLFPKKCSVIGMIHVKALPGTSGFEGSIKTIIESALQDAQIYVENKVDGLLIENMHDLPYVKGTNLGPEITAMMTKVCSETKRLAKNVPCGVQVLATGNKHALAIAQACSLDFIRAEGFVFGHVADEGYIDACAGEILRYRRNTGATNVLIFTDIKKKHSSHAITDDLTIIETAKAAEFFKSDGLIITGKETGDLVNINDLNALKASTSLPIIMGSGITKDNFGDYLDADAFIVGSHFKQGGIWNTDVCEKRVKQFMSIIKRLKL
ncbi:uncharacterized protein F13E9.13, mitochondrial [Agrilus planipennis]|uniref:Uncharacterized protein F13E9.13, mitochondrial n=1 Tax=Agrilus planipennis TaxID=224129 RepID=A0A1W4XN93_AGRPL|nr:uncharacterized protein F13E9.13, mitochondrial [Agrilus planipennis]